MKIVIQMKKVIQVGVLITVLLQLSPLLAQSVQTETGQSVQTDATLVQNQQGATAFPNMQGIVLTDSANIDIERINKAAESLKTKGYDVVVLYMDGDIGRTMDEAEGYFQDALESYSLGQGQDVFEVNENLVAIFVGTNPLTLSEGTRPIVIYTGNKVDLDTTQLRNEFMVPELQKGNFTKALTDSLSAAGRNLKALPGFSNARGGSGGLPAWLLPLAAVLAFVGLSRRRRKGGGQAGSRASAADSARQNSGGTGNSTNSATLQKAASEDVASYDIDASNISLEEKAELKFCTY